jgi:hypothetical protein
MGKPWERRNDRLGEDLKLSAKLSCFYKIIHIFVEKPLVYTI